jgi:hypothetical protein
MAEHALIGKVTGDNAGEKYAREMMLELTPKIPLRKYIRGMLKRRTRAKVPVRS